MTTKATKQKGRASGAGKKSAAKPQGEPRAIAAEPPPQASQETQERPSGLEAAPVAPSHSDEPPAASPESQNSSPAPAPANAADALNILDEAAQVPAVVPAAGGAGDAENSLIESVAASAAPAAPKRRGGFPKGMKRGPDGRKLSTSDGSTFPPRAGGPAGASAGTRSEARANARVAELEQQQSEQVAAGLAVALGKIASVGFGIVARRRGVHWNLSADEARDIGEAARDVALPYVKHIGPAMPFVVLFGTVYAAVGPRLEADEMIAKGGGAPVMAAETSTTKES